MRDHSRRPIEGTSPAEGLPDPAKGLGDEHRRRLKSGVEHVHGPEEVSYEKDELVVLCLVRDGRPYVKAFVEHYLSLGAKHLVFLDNGSTDGTVEALSGYENVTVLRTELPYREYKYLIKQYLHARFGADRWSLYVDIDELFDYPHSDVISLRSLLHYLNEKSYTAVVAHMLDMFPEEPLTGEANGEEEALKERHRFYDVSRLIRRDLSETPRIEGNSLGSTELETFSGGIRSILFDVRPALTKFPLVFSDGEIVPSDDSSHKVRGAKIADISCVLFHYKFLQRFHEQAVRAVKEGNYFGGSQEYRKYLEVLEKSPELRIKQTTSRELTDTNELMESGFLLVSEDFASVVDVEDEASLSASVETPKLARSLIQSRRREREKARKLRGLSKQSAGRELRINHLNRDLRQLRNSKRREEANANPAGAAKTGSLTTESGDDLPEELRPLFIGGCQRSGTTAFVDYLNEHETVLLCQERYKKIPKSTITPDLFTFERILNYRLTETNKPWNLELYIQRHKEILDRKNPQSLRWIGDKNPTFIKNMKTLRENNPGARFIMLYRPVEEVVESWDSRARDPEDHWSEDRDFKRAVKEWNKSMVGLREFIESQSVPRVLIVDYQDFFYDNEKCIPLISDFLGFEFDEEIRRSWAARSREFESGRRVKERLSEEQETFVRENADREAEAWVLKRLEAQWTRPELYLQTGSEALSRALDEMEARAWRLERRVRQRRERKPESEPTVEPAVEPPNEQSASRVRELEYEVESLRSSRALRLARVFGRVRNRVKATVKSVISRGKSGER